MNMIKFICERCSNSMNTKRTKEIPYNAVVGWCNYCPKCENEMDDYYNEFFIDEKGNTLEII